MNGTMENSQKINFYIQSKPFRALEYKYQS